MSAGEAGRHVKGFHYFVIAVFLEVQNERFSQILYLIYSIVYGFHLLYEMHLFKETCPKPISQHPGLATSLPPVHQESGPTKWAVHDLM